MKSFVSLMRLTEKGLNNLQDSGQRRVLSETRAAALGGQSKAFFATLGAYDFVQIFEMPDQATMMEYALSARKDGFVDPLILPAFEASSYSDILNRVNS